MQHIVDHSSRYRAELVALLVVTIWGVSFVFMKVALQEFGVWPFTGLRYLGMLGLGWAVLAWRARATGPAERGRAAVGVKRRDLPLIAATGLFGYVLYLPINTAGLSSTTAFSTSLLVGTAPLFAAVLLWSFKLERVTLAQLLGMLVSFLGVVVFVLDKVEAGAGPAGLGDLFSFGSAFFFAAYSVASKPLLTRYSVAEVITYTLTAGATPVALILLPATFTQDYGRVTPAGWAALLWAIAFPLYLGWSLWAWASARVGVGRTVAFMYLVPIVGGIASWLLLGESFGLLKLSGAGLVLGGLVLARGRVTERQPVSDTGWRCG